MSKKIPIRRRKIAEDYARKVRVEAPKQTRQEDPRTIRLRGLAAGAHDHGPAQKNKNKNHNGKTTRPSGILPAGRIHEA